MRWISENVSRRDFGEMSEYVAGPGKEFLESILKGDHWVLVDFGVWVGRNLGILIDLAGRKGLVIGFDHQNARLAIEVARERYRAFQQVKFWEGDLIRMKFSDGSFSGGLCWRVLHNLKGLGLLYQALGELRRVLKKGAPLLVAVRAFDHHQVHAPMLLQTQNPLGVKRFDLCFSQLACRTVFSKAGFEVRHLELITEEGLSDGKPYANVYWACHLVRH